VLSVVSIERSLILKQRSIKLTKRFIKQKRGDVTTLRRIKRTIIALLKLAISISNISEKAQIERSIWAFLYLLSQEHDSSL